MLLFHNAIILFFICFVSHCRLIPIVVPHSEVEVNWFVICEMIYAYIYFWTLAGYSAAAEADSVRTAVHGCRQEAAGCRCFRHHVPAGPFPWQSLREQIRWRLDVMLKPLWPHVLALIKVHFTIQSYFKGSVLTPLVPSPQIRKWWSSERRAAVLVRFRLFSGKQQQQQQQRSASSHLQWKTVFWWCCSYFDHQRLFYDMAAC